MDEAEKLVLHLKASGETFSDEEYVTHEIRQAIEAAERRGWDMRRDADRE